MMLLEEMLIMIENDDIQIEENDVRKRGHSNKLTE